MVGSWGSRLAALVLSLAAVSAVAAPGASAAGEPDTGGFATFSLQSSHGYRMFVVASSEPGYRRGRIVIWVTRRSDFVIYVAPAEVTDTTIDADLGKLGTIALEFERNGKVERTAPVCEPHSVASSEAGDYKGEFELHGEEGFTDVSVDRVRFDLHPFIDLICSVATSGETFGHGIRGARLTARGAVGKAKVALKALQNRPGARVDVEASLWEKRGRIRIQRSIERVYPAAAFHFDPQLRTAALRPSAPFSESAVFRRGAAKANRWRGSLSVDFPGRSNAPLAGGGFHASLIHARRVSEGTFHPDDSARRNLLSWPSTKPWPTAFATSSPLAPS